MVADFKCVRMGVLLNPADPYSQWYCETLRQIGLVFESGDFDLLNRVADFDVLLLAGYGELNYLQQGIVRRWLEDEHHQLILSGSFWGFESYYQISCKGLNYSRGEFHQPQTLSNNPLAQDCFGGQFFGGKKADSLPGETWAIDQQGNPLAARTNQLTVFVPHIGQSAALMLLGHGVSNDLIGPDDGSCFMEDGVQRSEDGTNFRWQDREQLEPDGAPAFLRPHFDELREQFTRLILNAIDATGKEAVILWHLPLNAESACTIAIECDEYEQELYRRISDKFLKFGYRPAWLVAPPGLPSDWYRAFKGWRHDIGHLYKQDIEHATEDQVRVQNTQIARGVGESQLPILKGWDGAWYGLTRIYRLAEAAGAGVSLCKGGRQPGTAGYLFGTSRPFIPRGKKRAYNVVEIPSLAFSPGVVTSGKVAFHLMQSVKRHHGVFHFSLLASHGNLDRFETRMNQIFLQTREMQLTPMPPSVIGDYERSRRKVRIEPTRHGLKITSENAIQGLTIMISGTSRLTQVGRNVGTAPAERYGKKWQVVVMKLEPRFPTELEMNRSQAA